MVRQSDQKSVLKYTYLMYRFWKMRDFVYGN